MFIFGFTPYIEMIITDPDHIAIKIAEYFPLYQNLNILNGESGAMEFVILAAWAAASFLLVLLTFNKRKNDE